METREYPIRKLSCRECSELLEHIPSAPEEVWVRGNVPTRDTKCLAVVGSRNYSDYGRQAVEHLIGGLRGYPIAIISGLARGMDSLAHTTALDAGLFTLAVPGSGLDDSVLYPRRNVSLARRILESGGGLLSEFEPTFSATKWSFPKRNRIMAGLAHATLLVEAGEKSGTLITARLATDFNRELLVVPANIFSENSKGVHQFLKLGATPITSPEDIVDIFELTKDETPPFALPSLSPDEAKLLSLLAEPKDSDTLIRELGLPSQASLMLLMKMELGGHIKEHNGVFYKV